MDRYTVPATLFSFLLAALTQACKCEGKNLVSSKCSGINTQKIYQAAFDDFTEGKE